MAKAEKNEEEKGEKRKREGRKKRTKWRQSKEDVRFVFLWRPWKSFVKEETWRVMVILSRGDLLEKPEDLSDCEPDTREHVRVVPDVTHVPVSPSSVVTEFCEVLSLCSDWEDFVPQSFFFLQKASTLLYKYARRDEVLKAHKGKRPR